MDEDDDDDVFGFVGRTHIQQHCHRQTRGQGKAQTQKEKPEKVDSRFILPARVFSSFLRSLARSLCFCSKVGDTKGEHFFFRPAIIMHARNYIPAAALLLLLRLLPLHTTALLLTCSSPGRRTGEQRLRCTRPKSQPLRNVHDSFMYVMRENKLSHPANRRHKKGP